jgi:hypothetical protein
MAPVHHGGAELEILQGEAVGKPLSSGPQVAMPNANQPVQRTELPLGALDRSDQLSSSVTST